MINHSKNGSYINEFWDKHITPTLIEYIRIPNKSPDFDPDWLKNGHMTKALKLAGDWAEKYKPDGSTVHIFQEQDRTPLIMIDCPGNIQGNILMYGHLDKQPEMQGWRDGFGPWDPVLKGDKLYGRGGADDGYAMFASTAAVRSLKDQNLDHPRIVILIEFSEESGSPDLPFYMDHCAPLIGKPDLVICLDSGARNYEQFWSTTSLRGLIGCTLRVDVLTEGVHSGSASGIVPSSFRVLRQLLSRIEDESSGTILLEDLNVNIPERRIKDTKSMVDALDGELDQFPWHGSMNSTTIDPVEEALRQTWKPALSIVGLDGIPAIKDGGNVLRPYSEVKLSMRIPPTLDKEIAVRVMKKTLTENPPYDASITVEFDEPATGWNAPEIEPWLDSAIQEASHSYFNKPALSMGEGGTIPFMAMLGKKFPKAQFVITGILGPQSNAHGPNEFIHIPYAKNLTASIASIIQQFPV
jgi:acetylornithine deacetylase/succinyl-diaminopimelate desuccinylase-like protein